MSPQQAADYHSHNIQGLIDGGAQLIQAVTMNYWEEAAGIVLASKKHQIPVIVLFTVETNGK